MKKEITKLKWSYDKVRKEWYVVESFPYKNDDFSIMKVNRNDFMLFSNLKFMKTFKKLSNAKQVAFLLRHG